MGAAGDMLMAALYELCSQADRAKFLADMNALLPGVEVRPQAARRQGIAGTHMSYTYIYWEEGEPHGHDHDHHHGHEHDHEHPTVTNMTTTTDILTPTSTALWRTCWR